ncbi:hypothetical protein HDC94_000437 [Leifsonia sp. AK011]|uniref:hypothetical protein n=1 Tax=Leifsonia sp. AK011 TaxID=2723075 RepID=UPI0015CC3002|nr:hypothetical protein [Leifsonia sp. AK011]NYF09281.1 hypothetical protein [Leifsonia sp. AK011]
MRPLVLGVVALAALALAGCSEVAAIAPVGGNRLSDVRYAAIDVLVDREVPILTAPVCSVSDDKAVSCEGETVDGEAITVTSTADDQASLTIEVGTETLFTGVIQDVLDAAMRPAS